MNLFSFIYSYLDHNHSEEKIKYFYNTQFGHYLINSSNSVSENFYQYIFKLSKKYINSDSLILDIGCGLGRLTFDYASLNPKNVVGIDTDVESIIEAERIGKGLRKEIMNYPINGPYEFYVTNGKNIDFPCDAFSFVVCINVIDRVKSPKLLVNEICNVTKTGGYVLMCDPYDWDKKYTPIKNQINNMKDVFNDKWKLEMEIDNIEYSFLCYNRKVISYSCHILLYQKI